MADLSLTEVHRLVAAANAARRRNDESGRAEEPSETEAERQLEALFRTSHTLAVYGTLAPGQPNHHVVAPLGGEWTDGVIEGGLVPVGWGATLGYPAFRPCIGGAAVAVQVLTAPLLATAWPTLDGFEGAEYRRILVPVFWPGLAGERRLFTVANVYAAAEPPMTSSQVRALVEQEIGDQWHRSNLHDVDLRPCLVEPERLVLRDAQDQPIDVWLVLRVHPEASDGYGLIFHEESGAFGLVYFGSGVPCFIGLYGDFFTAFEAM